MKGTIAIAFAAAALTALSVCGCYQSADITWYEAGVYKGARDPLLNKLKEPELQQQLQDRFRHVQSDR
jgi:hypothetical protein